MTELGFLALWGVTSMVDLKAEKEFSGGLISLRARFLVHLGRFELAGPDLCAQQEIASTPSVSANQATLRGGSVRIS